MAMVLSPEERDVIMEVLEARDQGLLKQISLTKQPRTKDILQRKEHLVGSLIEKFEAESQSESFTDLWW